MMLQWAHHLRILVRQNLLTYLNDQISMMISFLPFSYQCHYKNTQHSPEYEALANVGAEDEEDSKHQQ